MRHKYYEPAKIIFECFEKPEKMLEFITELHLILYRHDMGVGNKKWQKKEYEFVLEQLTESLLRPWIKATNCKNTLHLINAMAEDIEGLMGVFGTDTILDFLSYMKRCAKIMKFYREYSDSWMKLISLGIKGLKNFSLACDKIDASQLDETTAETHS